LPPGLPSLYWTLVLERRSEKTVIYDEPELRH
jgi:hypothetical protein